MNWKDYDFSNKSLDDLKKEIRGKVNVNDLKEFFLTKGLIYVCDEDNLLIPRNPLLNLEEDLKRVENFGSYEKMKYIKEIQVSRFSVLLFDIEVDYDYYDGHVTSRDLKLTHNFSTEWQDFNLQKYGNDYKYDLMKQMYIDVLLKMKDTKRQSEETDAKILNLQNQIKNLKKEKIASEKKTIDYVNNLEERADRIAKTNFEKTTNNKHISKNK